MIQNPIYVGVCAYMFIIVSVCMQLLCCYCCCHYTVMGLRVVPGGCTSVRQTIGDILSTANVVTAAATQTKSFPMMLGEPRQRTATDGAK